MLEKEIQRKSEERKNIDMENNKARERERAR